MSRTYYCLSLNGCKEKDIHWVSKCKPNTRITGESKKIEKLPALLDEEFMDMADKIIETQEGYVIEESVPVIGYEEDGKMYDAITELYIPEVAKDEYVEGLSYYEKMPAYSMMAEHMIEELSNETKEKYLSALINLKNSKSNEKNRVYYYIPTQLGDDINLIFAYKENGKMYELFTNLRIEEKQENTVSRYLEFPKESINQVSDYQVISQLIEKRQQKETKERYLDNVYKLYLKSIFEYNSYIHATRYNDISVKEYKKRLSN